MPSGGIQTLLEETRSDAILFHDCCHSADTARTKFTPQGITELVAACGFQTTAPGVGPTSFTHALTNALTEYRQAARQFSVSDLYTTVLANLRGVPGRTDQTTPAHCSLTSEQTGRHIMLAPANAPDAQLVFSEERDVVTLSFEVDHASFDFESWRDWTLTAPPDATKPLLLRRTTRPDLEDDEDEGYGSPEYCSGGYSTDCC